MTRHGTELPWLRIRWCYVKMLDAREGPGSTELVDQAFTSKSPYHRCIAACAPQPNLYFHRRLLAAAGYGVYHGSPIACSVNTRLGA